MEYSLTPLGQTLIEPIWGLRAWSEQHIEEVEQARAEYDSKNNPTLQQEIMTLVQQRADAAKES